MKKTLSILLSVTVCISCSQLKTNSKTEKQIELLNKNQTEYLFQNIINDIETYDAEMIYTRNNNKDISWDSYKEYHKGKWETGVTEEALRELFYDFGKGYVNGHSRFRFLYPKKSQVKKKRVFYKSEIKLGYTYPEVSFFDLETKNTIIEINDVPIKDILWEFKNYKTKSINENAVIDAFKEGFENRFLKIENEFPHTATFSNGQKKTITYIEKTTIKRYDIYANINVDNYKNWKLISKGYKVALLQKNNVALIKIRNFKYPNGRGGGVSCEDVNPADSTMCKDVRLLKTGLDSISKNIEYLIFDLQGNHGGQENTPFLKMFSPGPFYDLRVQYRKTPLLLNPKIREALNYYESRGENWFKQIKNNGIYDKTKEGDFLPPRADFCRGDFNCKLVKQKPNDALTSKFKKIIILVNDATASSADDFTFRFKENKNVYVAGQPQASDLTYALITVLYYLDEEGKIQKIYYGNIQEEPKVEGTKLFKFDIPYSKTVGENGEILQGNPLPLDLLVPITKENFKTKEIDVLNNVLEKMCN